MKARRAGMAFDSLFEETALISQAPRGMQTSSKFNDSGMLLPMWFIKSGGGN